MREKIIYIASMVLFSVPVLGQNCESVIELSKIRNTVVQDISEVNQHASNFCKEYMKFSGSSSDQNFGASYKFLSASFGSKKASKEEVASKYCASDKQNTASKDAYKQYIESISPGAYGAYEQCIKMSEEDIRFNVDLGSILPAEFSVSVSFVSTASLQKSATLAYSSSDDVRCKWGNIAESKMVLDTGSTAYLKCKRDDQTKKSYVKILQTDGANLPLTLPWQAYDKNGIPINALNEINNEINTVYQKVQELNNGINNNSKKIKAIPTPRLPQCIIRGGNTVSCPAGYTSYGGIGDADKLSCGDGGSYNWCTVCCRL